MENCRSPTPIKAFQPPGVDVRRLEREHSVVSLTLPTFRGPVSVCSVGSIFWLTAAVADGVCLIQLVPSTVWAALCCPGGGRHSRIWDILQGCDHRTLPAPSGHWWGGRSAASRALTSLLLGLLCFKRVIQALL